MISHDGYEHGKLFHHLTGTILLFIFIANLVCLVLSIYYYNLAISDPSFITKTTDGGTLFVYLATLPFLTLAHTSTQLLLSNCTRFLTPKAMVFTGSLLTLGWIASASIWTECELVQPVIAVTALPGWCPQSRLSVPTVRGIVFQKGLTIAKDLLGWVVGAAFVVYTLSACVVWERLWMEANKSKNGKGKEREVV